MALSSPVNVDLVNEFVAVDVRSTWKGVLALFYTLRWKYVAQFRDTAAMWASYRKNIERETSLFKNTES